MKTADLRFIIMILLLSISGYSCKNQSSEYDIVSSVAEYCAVYQQRVDFDAFLDYYADTVVLEDIISGTRVAGKDSLALFFDWHNTDYRSVDSITFDLMETVVEDDKAVLIGYFNPFEWSGTRFESMHFVSVLSFNAAGKIVRQQDWINYPSSLLDYNARLNSNKWITENLH